MTESLTYDVVIVGAGPSGLSAAIRLKQLRPQLSVAVLEKADRVGDHILSGAVIDPRALDALLPHWKDAAVSFGTPVVHEAFYGLTSKKSIRLPIPPLMRNEGSWCVQLGKVCAWMASEAASLGVDIFPGFPVGACVYGPEGDVTGVCTMPQGSEPGVAIHAQWTLLSEGCRGSLTESIMDRFDLRRDLLAPQTYGLGLKELWQIPDSVASTNAPKPGTIWHTLGWPLGTSTYGGGFCYHLQDGLVAIGLVVGLDYTNTYINPYEEFQRFKHHPLFEPVLKGAKRLSYGARALNEGGYQSLPQLDFPGGMIIGCGAGFMNVPRIKGTHTAMQSGIEAAEAIIHSTSLTSRVQASWISKELYTVRNIRPAFARWGLWGGLAHTALTLYLTRGKEPWTLITPTPDAHHLKPAAACAPIVYPPHDGRRSFDLMTSVYLSNTYHDHNQPCHLHIEDDQVAQSITLGVYDGPEQRYCPAGVYEYIPTPEGGQRLQINAQNCLHCKTCDIKDPTGNIRWTPPQKGGPSYGSM